MTLWVNDRGGSCEYAEGYDPNASLGVGLPKDIKWWRHTPAVTSMQISANPKNLAASARVKIGYLPPAGIIHGAHACMDGASKYGAYNWRDTRIALMEYISAAHRHLISFQEGEPLDPKSGVHHLGHVIATCAIMLDAIELGFHIDDRPGRGRGHELLDQIRSDLEKRLSENV